VAFEWGANRFHKNYNQLYRVSLLHPQGHYMAPGFAPLLKNSFPAVNNVVRIADIGKGLIAIDGSPNNATKPHQYREEQVSYVDADFFRVFSFPVIQGDADLSQSKTAALSATVAKKYFGDASPVGRVMTINNQFGKGLYKVTGVYNDMPEQSDIKADILLSIATLQDPAFLSDNTWADPKGLNSGYCNIYVLLNKGTDANQLAKQADHMKDKLQPENRGDKFAFQPMAQVHIAPSFKYPLQTFGSLVLVTAFGAVALLILVIAWVNYINLSVAQSLNRSREIGVRKVLGAMRRQLVLQFLAETAAVTFGSVLIAISLVYMLQPLYNSFVDKNLSLSVLNQGWFWPAATLLTVGGSLSSGVYVAFILSSFNPIKTLSGKLTSLKGGLSFRKGLVVFQFMVSVVFIISTMVLYRQLNYMKNQDLGMKVNQRLVIVGPDVNGGKVISQGFKNRLSALPFVQKYAASNDIPGKGYNFSASGITRLNPNPGDEKKEFSMLQVDDKYFDTYDIQFVAGSNFTAQNIDDGYRKTTSLIINQKAAEILGFKRGERVVGQKIKWGKIYDIAGVVKDYHHLSLHELIQPMIFLPSVSSGFYTVKLSADRLQSKISALKQIYQAQFPGNPFEYFFLDQNYDKQYKAEQRLGNVFIASALVAIFIACLGLFGMASFSAQQRVKEIGIRKVLGAGVSSIVKLIASDFLKLVLLAVIVASPVAAYIMNKWLQDFAYRIQLQWWLFALAGCVALAIALFTISFQAIKAAVANPVKSLRSE
jgi:putative ABC transport system permease protein